jgi:hypothetical protein
MITGITSPFSVGVGDSFAYWWLGKRRVHLVVSTSFQASLAHFFDDSGGKHFLLSEVH